MGMFMFKFGRIYATGGGDVVVVVVVSGDTHHRHCDLDIVVDAALHSLS